MKESSHSLDLSRAGLLFFIGDISGNRQSRTTQTVAPLWPKTHTFPPLYVCAPSMQLPRLYKTLYKLGVPCHFELPTIQTWQNLQVCHFHPHELDQRQRRFLRDVEEQGAIVRPLLDYLEEHLKWVEIDLIDTDSHFTANTHASVGRRLLDISLASLIGLVALPISLIIAAAIKWESPGPVFFRQKRTGLHDQEFEIIKFRSMYQDAERHGARWAAINDDRITKVGRVIRRLRLDELPQLINVLKGDMAMVGPRPEREVFIKDLEQQIPLYRLRHQIKPGITGFAQVMYTYGASLDDAKQKHRYDLYYLKHRCATLDARILGRTAWVMLTGKGV